MIEKKGRQFVGIVQDELARVPAAVTAYNASRTQYNADVIKAIMQTLVYAPEKVHQAQGSLRGIRARQYGISNFGTWQPAPVAKALVKQAGPAFAEAYADGVRRGLISTSQSMMDMLPIVVGAVAVATAVVATNTGLFAAVGTTQAPASAAVPSFGVPAGASTGLTPATSSMLGTAGSYASKASTVIKAATKKEAARVIDTVKAQAAKAVDPQILVDIAGQQTGAAIVKAFQPKTPVAAAATPTPAAPATPIPTPASPATPVAKKNNTAVLVVGAAALKILLTGTLV